MRRQPAVPRLAQSIFTRGHVSRAQTQAFPAFDRTRPQRPLSKQQQQQQQQRQQQQRLTKTVSAEIAAGGSQPVLGYPGGCPGILRDHQTLLAHRQQDQASSSLASALYRHRESSPPSRPVRRGQKAQDSAVRSMTRSARKAQPAPQEPVMDPSRPRNWQQSQDGEYPPPMQNGLTPLAFQFGMPVAFNPLWNQAAAWSAPYPAGQSSQQIHGQNQGRSGQPAPQRPPYRAGQARQQMQGRPQTEERGRGQGRYQTPTQLRRQRQRRNGPGGRVPEQRRAPAPTSAPAMDQSPPFPTNQTLPFPMDQPFAFPMNQQFAFPMDQPFALPMSQPLPFPIHQPLPIPMDNAFLGPFGATPALRQNQLQHAQLENLAPMPDSTPFLPSTAAAAGQNGNNMSSTARSRPRSSSDVISPPSAESGGVPDPTPAYLARSSRPPVRAASPQPILVVIDLNGTLLYRPQKRFPSKFVERPMAREFLQHCIDRHHVVIWSSARPDNVRRMCEQLLAGAPPSYPARLVAVWGRDRFGLTADDYARRTQCYKRLTRLWEDPAVAASYPHRQNNNDSPDSPDSPDRDEHGPSTTRAWHQGNTVLIDDSAEKARSEPHNAVTLPAFAGNVDERPPVLPLVQAYLDELAWHEDVSAYMRARPFTVGPPGGGVGASSSPNSNPAL